MQRISLALRYIRRNVSLAIGLGILIFLILFAVIGSFLVDTKVDPYPLAGPASVAPTLNYCPRTDPECAQVEPVAYPFGTDGQGRDLFAVAVAGTWMTIRIGLLAGMIGLAIGTVLGFTSAYYGGAYDAFIQWTVDVLLTVPGLLILIIIASTIAGLEDGKTLTIDQMGLVIALLAWMGPTRTIRSQVLSMRERPYVMMARLNGMSSLGIIFRELIPNLLPYLGAGLVGSVTGAIFASMGLAALGLGPLREPTLGVTIYWVINQNAFLRGLWWWAAVPITIVALIFIMLFLISMGLDEVANPRVRRAR